MPSDLDGDLVTLPWEDSLHFERSHDNLLVKNNNNNGRPISPNLNTQVQRMSIRIASLVASVDERDISISRLKLSLEVLPQRKC